MALVQEERWGWVVYDPRTDEFIAEVRPESQGPLLDHPLSAGCLVTGKCNYRCEYCYGNLEALPKDTLDAKAWRVVFRQLRALGVMRVDLSGGEPTVRKDISQIVAAALD